MKAVSASTADGDRPIWMKQYKDHLSPTSCQVVFAQLFNQNAGMIIMSCATIYALFGDDIRLLTSHPSVDDVWYGFSTFVLILFFLELIAFSLASKGYLCSFFFTLDVVAVATMVLDVPPVWNAIYVAFGGDISEVSNAVDTSTTQNLRAVSRSAKAGAKAAKMLRVIRIIRLVRIIKLYKYFKKRKDTKEEQEEEEHEKFSETLSGSAIGAELSDRTTQICVVVVLVMLLTTTFLSVSAEDSSKLFKLQHLGDLGPFGLHSDPAMHEFYIKDYQTLFGDKLYLLRTPGRIKTDDIRTIVDVQTDDIRAVELEKLPLDVDADSKVDYEAWVSIRPQVVLDSTSNILLSLFVIAVLGTAVYLFSKTTNETVVLPIERMVKFVGQLAANPLGKIRPTKITAMDKAQGFETTLLENTLMKLGGLLQVSFGMAGSEIIGKNLNSDGLNVMIKGQKIFAVFGFCDIQHFNDITGVLQTETMMFVNQVAEIVHERTHKFGGAANKNTGNAFLLVWKFPSVRDTSILDVAQNPILEEKNQEELKLGDDAESRELQMHLANPVMRAAATSLADQALTAFVHTIVQIATHEELGRWRTHKQLLKYDPNYEIEMGFGLHIGWSIEGAIGSTHKVDASYLSPNVNMSARLEGATKQFGVKLLFSGVFRGLLQPKVRNMCRMLDRITLKGSLVPIDIYTFDLYSDKNRDALLLDGADEIRPVHLSELVTADDDPASAREENEDPSKTHGMVATIKKKMPGRSSAKVVPKIEEPSRKADKEQHGPEHTPQSLFEKLELLQRGLPPTFVTTFNQASACYIKGEWPQAKELLMQVQKLKAEDKPTKVLLRVMGEHDFNAPSTWKGYRALTAK